MTLNDLEHQNLNFMVFLIIFSCKTDFKNELRQNY